MAEIDRHSDAAPAAARVHDDARQRSLLRFMTCGSVDDGKSTLIGRLLYEAGSVPEDTLSSLKSDSKKFGTTGAEIDFALLVDGLSAEREQGITIDVAYRYFATQRRSFIVADTPGHEQYTRNMATGASSAELAIILVDASKGILPQTRRHSFIMSLVGVRHIVVAINKMDLIDFDQDGFRTIERDYRETIAKLGFESIVCIPVAARSGDNVASPSPRMPWYHGLALLDHLENIETACAPEDATGWVLPVQYVNRPDASFRGYCGTVAAGQLKIGDIVRCLPRGGTSRISRIVTFDGDLTQAVAGQAVTITLTDEIDISRGDVLTSEPDSGQYPQVRVAQSVDVRILVTANRSILPGQTFVAKIGAASVNAVIGQFRERINISDFSAEPAAALPLNALGVAELRFDRPVVCSAYTEIRDTGCIVLIDRLTNETAAMGVVIDSDRDIRAGEASGSVTQKFLRWIEQKSGKDWRMNASRFAAWRLVSSLFAGALIYAVTGDWRLAWAGFAIDMLVRPALRHLFERSWSRIRRPARTSPASFVDGAGI